MFGIKRYSFSYPMSDGYFQLKIEDFVLELGEIVFLHGRSGCGKTTLLNLLSGIIKTEIAEDCRRNFKSIAYIMHESTLLPWLSIEGNISIEKKLRRQNIDIDLFILICERIGLSKNILAVKPRKLSLGMRQRVEIAKALCFHPGLLLLDEALSGIDSNNKKDVAKIIWENVVGKKMTVVGTAHHIGDLLMLAEKVCIFDNGIVRRYITIEKTVDERLNMNIEQLYNLKDAKNIIRLLPLL